MGTIKSLAIAVVVLCAVAAHSQPSGLYYGASATLQQAEVVYAKAVRSIVRESGDSTIRATASNIDDRPLQWDGLAGLRINIAEGTQFVSLQAEVSLAGDDISGRLDGDGDSTGMNLFGEAWPEDWSLKTTRSVGVIAKYGIHRSLFGALDFSVYGLAGARRTKIDFFSTFRGCFNTLECDANQFRNDSLSINPEFNIVVAGIGLESGVTSKTAFQFELRHVEDVDTNWFTMFSDDSMAVEIPSGLEIKNTDLTIKMIRYL